MTPQTACQTVQAAIGKMPLGHHGLALATGVYEESVEVFHGRQISIFGPMEGNFCPSASAVTVSRFWVQDNATLWVNCLTTGSVGCRQWAIADVINVVFDGTAPTALVANETCRINTSGSLTLNGPVSAFAVAQNYSTIYLAGNIAVSQPNLSLAYFLRAIDATIDLSSAVFSGHALAAGLRYTLDHGVIVFPRAGSQSIPGDGSESINFSVCRPCN